MSHTPGGEGREFQRECVRGQRAAPRSAPSRWSGGTSAARGLARRDPERPAPGRRRVSRQARLARVLLVVGCCSLLSCSERRAQVEGWPRPGVARSGPVDARPADRPTRTVDGDRVLPPIAARPVPFLPTRAVHPCESLVDEACRLLGPHTEECGEARRGLRRGRLSDDHPAVQIACREVLDDHLERSPRGGTACWHLSQRVCEEHGKRSPRCQEIRARAGQLRKAHKHQACEGDLLLWDAQHALSARSAGSGR